MGIIAFPVEVEPLSGQDPQKRVTRRGLRMIKGRGTNKGERLGEQSEK